MGNRNGSFLIHFEHLKKKIGHTLEFKEFEKRYSNYIKFLQFKEKNKLKYFKKTGWNKSFSPITKNIWISTPKKNWNRSLRKHGYYESIQVGWELSADFLEPKCQWCKKFLKNPKQTKFCDNPSHRKLFSKVITIGKKRYGFDLENYGHFLIKPKLYDYKISKSGFISEIPLGERIEFKDIKFVINSKQHTLTKKSRTI